MKEWQHAVRKAATAARDFGATPDGRKQYVGAFFRNLDCDHVNRQLVQAEAARLGAEASGAHERQSVAH